MASVLESQAIIVNVTSVPVASLIRPMASNSAPPVAVWQVLELVRNAVIAVPASEGSTMSVRGIPLGKTSCQSVYLTRPLGPACTSKSNVFASLPGDAGPVKICPTPVIRDTSAVQLTVKLAEAVPPAGTVTD